VRLQCRVEGHYESYDVTRLHKVLHDGVVGPLFFSSGVVSRSLRGFTRPFFSMRVDALPLLTMIGTLPPMFFR